MIKTPRTLFVAALLAVPALLVVKQGDAATPTPEVARFHLALSKAEPAADRSVAVSPKTIKLWFTETVKASVTRVKITGAGKHDVELSPITIADEAKAPAIAEIKEVLKPGIYTVEWKTMSADGHPSTGTFVFTVAAKTTP